MISAVVKVKREQRDTWESLGSCHFAVLPRAGEHIVMDVADVAIVYCVVGVHHKPCARGSTDAPAGELYVVDLGNVVNESTRLFREC